MTDIQPTVVPPDPLRRARLVALALLVVLIGIALWMLFFTARGRALVEDPHAAGRDVREWVGHHAAEAPLIYLGVYILAVVLTLPVWWLQILAGYGFGIYFGVWWTQIASVIGGVLAMAISRWLGGEWIRARMATKMQKLQKLDETMGHNGLLVVMAARLIHIVPFSLSNYFFGLTRITFAELILGTLLGGIPAAAFYVGAGAGYHPWRNWRFILVITLINLLLLIPLAVRYLRPQWFRKIGVE